MRPMKPYSEDLRVRIVRAVQEESISKFAAARLFGVSLSSVKRYASLADRGTSLAPRKGGGRPPKSLFGKVHSPLASRLSIRRIIATLMNVSLLCTFRS